MRSWASILGTTFFFIAVVNFLAFFVVALVIGGDALNGHEENGHYFLRDHGRVTEVSEGVWIYSRIHAISVFITHAVGIIGGGGLLSLARRRVTAR